MIGHRIARSAGVLSVLLLAFMQHALATETAQRIVSIDGSVTEIIFALGAETQLVGVDTTSRFPDAATSLPDVGYMRRLSAEGILSLQPTLVLASQDAGPALVFEQLEAAGVQVVRIESRYTVNGVLDKIAQTADAVGKTAEGERLQRRIRQNTDHALAQIPQGASPKTLFLLGAGDRGLMAAGQGTQAAAMLDLVKAENVVSHPGYKPVSPEGALMLAPDVVLAAHTGEGVSSRLDRTLAMTPAHKDGRIHSLDISLVLGFGPRIDQAVNALIALLYPDTEPAVALH